MWEYGNAGIRKGKLKLIQKTLTAEFECDLVSREESLSILRHGTTSIFSFLTATYRPVLITVLVSDDPHRRR